MHPNPLFRNPPEGEMLAMARARGFGLLAVNGEGAPLLAQVPFVLSKDGSSLDFHLARSNPVARMDSGCPAVLAVNGPDAYVSPDWYGVEDQVPTWNYIAVHLRGRLEPLLLDTLPGHLDALSAEFEARLLPKKPWTADKMSEGLIERMMRGILPFRLVIEDVQGTWKLGQNKTVEQQSGAALGIAGAGIGHDSADIAGLMQENARSRQPSR